MNDTIVNSNLHGLIAIINERNDQIHKHGFTVEYDVLHNQNGELITAARALMKDLPTIHDFPDYWDESYVKKMISKPLVQRYVIAGAFLAAEVDRKKYIEEVLKKRHEVKKPLTPSELLTPKRAFKK